MISDLLTHVINSISLVIFHSVAEENCPKLKTAFTSPLGLL